MQVDEALRFHMAGEKLPMRHFLLCGRLGTGRRTAADLIAKALASVGIIQNNEVCDTWAKARPGWVVFIDHVKGAQQQCCMLESWILKGKKSIMECHI